MALLGRLFRTPACAGLRPLPACCRAPGGRRLSSPPAPGAFGDAPHARSTIVPYLGSAQDSQPPIDVELDTFAAAQRLRTAGLTERQGDAVVDLVRWILQVRLGEFRKSLVTAGQCDNVPAAALPPFAHARPLA